MNEDSAATRTELEQAHLRIRQLEQQLAEANHTLEAIRRGEIDALVISQGDHQQVLSLDKDQLWIIADAVPAILGYVDKSLHFRFVNRQYESWFNRPRHEIRGKHVSEILGAEAFEVLRPIYETCLSGQEVTYDGWAPLRTGKKFIRARYIPDRDPSGTVNGFFVLALDYTEQKLSEDVLLKETQRTQLILESISDCFYTLDRNFVIRDLNPQAVPFFGGTRESVLGRSLWEIFPALIGSDVEKEYRRALDQNVPVHLEIPSQRLPGVWLEIRIYPYLDGLSVFFRDITSRKQAESRMREGEQRLRTALESGRMVAWEYDIATASAHFSETAATVLGLASSTLTRPGSDIWSCVHPADKSRYQETVVTALRNRSSYRVTFRFVRPDNNVEIWVEDSGQVICDESGKPARIVGVAHDTTDRRMAERNLEQARLEADAANRAKSEFIANMSHEIRTPMTAILGYADVLAAHLVDPDNLQCVQTIRRNGRFLLEIINDILDLSKIEAGRLEVSRERVAIPPMVHELIDLMRMRAEERGISLAVEFEGRVPAVIESDSKRLRQILVNLLGNAVKFTEEGSVNLVVRHEPDEGQLIFEVSDTGIGISQEHQRRLFHPFTQADTGVARQYEGTGLGLSISRRLADMLGGKIELESQVGQGSTFRLILDVSQDRVLQLVEPPPFDPARPPTSEPTPRRLSCRALVVDDRRDVRYLAQHFIEEAGGIVLTASNGREAVDLVQEHQSNGDGIDVIVMDIQMPIMDGYAAARQLRANGFSRPIIALTANAMQGDRDKCLAAGYDDYTSKPIDGPRLVSLIYRYTERR